MKTEDYVTADLALATFLLQNGHRLVGVDRIRPNKSAFRFADSSDRQKDVLAFINRKARVEPNKFLDHLKSLKATVG